MSDAPTLTTDRLLLRAPEAQDLDGWTAFVQDATTMEHLGGKTLSRHEAWRQLCTMAGSWRIRGFGMFSVIERRTGVWVGRIGPWQPEDWPGREVGWGVRSTFAGKGYAYEAAVATMDYVFRELAWDSVIHTIVPENVRSWKLAQRLGSTNLGPTRLPPPLDHLEIDEWGQTREEWLGRTADLAVR